MTTTNRYGEFGGLGRIQDAGGIVFTSVSDGEVDAHAIHPSLTSDEIVMYTRPDAHIDDYGRVMLSSETELPGTLL